MELTPAYLSKLTIMEQYQFYSEILKLINPHSSLHPKLATVLITFQSSFDAFEQALKPERSNSQVQAINEADVLRDNAHYAIALLLQAFLLSQNEAQSNDALLLKRIMDKFGNIRHQSHNKQSAATRSLLIDFEEANASTAISNLGVVQPFIAEMRAANDKVITLMEARHLEDSEKIKGLVADCRQKTETAYRESTRIFNSLLILDDTEPQALENTAKQLNSVIDYYNIATNRRGKRTTKGDSATPASDGNTSPMN